MSFAVAAVVVAGGTLAYSVYAGEKAANEARRADQAVTREQQKLEREEKDQKAKMEATETRDRLKRAQKARSVTPSPTSGMTTAAGAQTFSSNSIGTYQGKTLLGG